MPNKQQTLTPPHSFRVDPRKKVSTWMSPVFHRLPCVFCQLLWVRVTLQKVPDKHIEFDATDDTLHVDTLKWTKKFLLQCVLHSTSMQPDAQTLVSPMHRVIKILDNTMTLLQRGLS